MLHDELVCNLCDSYAQAIVLITKLQGLSIGLFFSGLHLMGGILLFQRVPALISKRTPDPLST